MKFIRDEAELSHLLNSDLSWRRRELSDLKSAIKKPLPQNLWVKTGIIALRSGARFLEVVHNRPIREWV